MKLVIFGCGNIAHRIAKSCKLVDSIQLLGFASKDINKAKDYANLYNCPFYGNYDFFLNNDDVDAVYIATYNPSHYQLIKDCINHHKSVICEKPMLSSKEETIELFSLAKQNNVSLMEAMKAVFLPVNINIKENLDNYLGQVTEISASFLRGSSFDSSHWIYDLKTGGALKDLGSYCAAVINFILKKEPKVITKEKNNTDTLADTISKVTLDYDGIKASIYASNVIEEESKLVIKGEKGIIEVINFWKSDSFILNNEIIKLPFISDFYYELEHFAKMVDSNILQSNIMNLKASLDILTITE